MSQDARKKNKDKVRFEEETVWMSIEDFQRGKLKDLHDIRNLRIEQDFNLSQPENCQQFKGNKLIFPLEGNVQEEEDNMTSQRKIQNKEQQQKIYYKKVIDGLDLWKNELNQKKRLEANSNLIFIQSDKSDQFAAKKKSKDPELDMRLLDSIVSIPEEEMKKMNFNDKKKRRQNDENEDPIIQKFNNDDEVNSVVVSQRTISKRNSLIMSFPKSLSQIPTRPITLTSLKMKNVDDFKHKTVSRYVFDEDNKVVMKTDAQLQAEQNNQVINQIFKNKLSKIIEVEKPNNKNQYEEIVNNQTVLFKKETLSNFKSLHYLRGSQEKGTVVSNLRDPSHPQYGTIEYKKLYNELYENKLIKKNPLLEQEKKQLLSRTQYLDEQEKNMLHQYKTHSENYKFLKEALNKMRVLLNINAQKKKSKVDEQKAVADEYDREIRNLESENIQSTILQLQTQSKSRRSIFQPVQVLASQIEMLKEKKIDVLSDIQKQIVELVDEHKDIQNEVEQTQKQHQTAKERRNQIKFELKSHYIHNLNKQINEKNNKSLIWTIIKLFQIKEQVTFNMFPEYLEESIIEFLITQAKLELEKSDKQLTLKILQNSENFLAMQQNYNKKMMDMQQQNGNQKQRNHSQIALSQQMITSSSQLVGSESTTKLSMIKKPIFILDPQSEPKECQITFQLENQPLQKGNEQTIPKQKFDEQFKIIKDIERQVKQLENQITLMKSKEFERLCLKYQKDNQECQNIFYAIFGYLEGEKYHYEFERKKQKIDQIITANKTFQFSQAIGAQANLGQRKSSVGSTLPQNGKTPQENSNSSNNTNSNNAMRNTSYSLSGYVKDRKNNASLPENILEPIKNNQLLLGIKKSQIGGEIKSSVDLKVVKEIKDAFSYFSPKVPRFIQKKLNEQSKYETGTVSVGMVSPRTLSNHTTSLLNQGIDKKNVAFNFNEPYKLTSHYDSSRQYAEQNSRQLKNKMSFLSSYFIPDDKNGFSTLQSPINKNGKNHSLLQSPLISDNKFTKIFQSDQQQNYKIVNPPKQTIKVSQFIEDSSTLKQFG